VGKAKRLAHEDHVTPDRSGLETLIGEMVDQPAQGAIADLADRHSPEKGCEMVHQRQGLPVIELSIPLATPDLALVMSDDIQGSVFEGDGGWSVFRRVAIPEEATTECLGGFEIGGPSGFDLGLTLDRGSHLELGRGGDSEDRPSRFPIEDHAHWIGSDAQSSQQLHKRYREGRDEKSRR